MGLLRKPVLRGGPERSLGDFDVAIYSLNHSSIGRSTHAAGTAGAHVGYITRSSACLTVMAERMPSASPGQRGGEARSWLDAQEAADRKNARVIDKVMLALPKELTPEQQAALVRSFAEDVTQGQAPWFAAIHADHPENPHCHLVIRDKHPETGKRVVGLSEKGSTERLREQWERAANLALELAGREERIDRRSLKAQGIDLEPTIHVGPQVVAMERQSKAIESKPQEVIVSNGMKREIRWPEIDGGKSRAEHNKQVRARNASRMLAEGLQGALRASATHPTRIALSALSKAREGVNYALMTKEQINGAWDREFGAVLKSVQLRAGVVLERIEAAKKRALGENRREQLERVAKKLSNALMLRQIARRILVKANPELDAAVAQVDKTPDPMLAAWKTKSQAEHQARQIEAQKIVEKERAKWLAQHPKEPIAVRSTQPRSMPSPTLSAEMREKVQSAAQEQVRQFQEAAWKRSVGAFGYTDLSDHWRQMPSDAKAAIEGFNKLSPADQKRSLEQMKSALVKRYSAEPAAIERDRERQREAQSRGIGR